MSNSKLTVLILGQLLTDALPKDSSLHKEVVVIFKGKESKRICPVRATAIIQANPQSDPPFDALALSASHTEGAILSVIGLAQIVTELLERDNGHLEVVVSETLLTNREEHGTIYFVHGVFDLEESENQLNALAFVIFSPDEEVKET